ncbi:hypothetical protein [Pelagibacterium sediminicola]|uniref:hypothetical protein n=1 Tax=Pelagibacterium sediminicola TaxID=2248761 RepID=UPI000E3175F7|nr:hypothetical protein [Pelagibacterium sediminicola]
MRGRFIGALLLTALCTPVQATPEEMIEAIRSLDVQAVEQLVWHDEPITQSFFEVILDVAHDKLAMEPEEVYWNGALREIVVVLAGVNEPDEETFASLAEALELSELGQAHRDLQRNLNIWVWTEGREGVLFKDDLRIGADPSRRPFEGGHPDMFGFLIEVAQAKRQTMDDAPPPDADTPDWRDAVYEAFDELRYRATPDPAARYFLDAALTAPGADIVYTGMVDGVRGNLLKMAPVMAMMQHDDSDGSEADLASAYAAFILEQK